MATTTGMEVVGECITTRGCIQAGGIMTLGIQDIMVTDPEIGTTLGGVITVMVMEDITGVIMEVITVTTTIMATVVAGMVVAAMEI